MGNMNEMRVSLPGNARFSNNYIFLGKEIMHTKTLIPCTVQFILRIEIINYIWESQSPIHSFCIIITFFCQFIIQIKICNTIL